MTAIGSKKPPLSRKSIAGQILFVVALLLVARILWTRNQPERLTKVAQINFNYKIVGDNIYGLGSVEPAIRTQSVHGSRSRTLVPNDPNYPFYSQSTDSELTIVEGTMYYVVKARSIPSSESNAYQGSPSYLLPPNGLPNPPIARQKRAQRTQYPPSADEIKIRQIPLQGGTPHDVATFHTDNLCLVGSHVFWIRPEAEETEQVSYQGRKWWEATAHSDLMLTSLTEGTTRCIHHGIYRHTFLKLQPTGISWIDLAPYPTQLTLFYTNASDGIVHALGPLKNQSPNPSAMDLLELGGRLYWSTNQGLMSSTLDGTDIREILKPSEKHMVPLQAPFLYRNSLYFYMQEESRSPKDQPPTYLCRLHPDQSDPLEIVRKLPALTTYTPSDGYLYFDRKEQHGSLWATLTNDDANETTEYVLCRIPMQP